MSLRWYQDDLGDTSMMRIGAMIGIADGGIVCLIGVALAVFGNAAQVGAGQVIVGIGAGLITGVLAMKALQRGAEAKIPQ